MRESLEDLVPAFEKASGHKVTIIFKSGVDVSAALRAGDQADLVVSTDTALDELAKEGKVVAGSRVDFVAPTRRRGGEGRRAEARHQHARRVPQTLS